MQTNMFEFDYYNLKIELAKPQVIKEIEFLETWKEYPEFEEYIEYLKGRIGLATVTSKYKSTITSYKDMNMSEHNKNIDELMFKKPWRNLNIFYRKMKLQEYLNSIDAIDLLDEILDGIANKKFVGNKDKIVYDPESMSITSISCVVKHGDKYICQWKK